MVAWGIVVIVLGLVAWLGQILSWLAPKSAVRLGVSEAEESVEPSFWADIRAEAAWDAFTLWTLPLAGFLLIVDSAAWPQWGLIGGAIYLYFGGRGVLARLQMRQRRLRAGTPTDLRSALVTLPIWAMAGLITVIAALNAL